MSYKQTTSLLFLVDTELRKLNDQRAYAAFQAILREHAHAFYTSYGFRTLEPSRASTKYGSWCDACGRNTGPVCATVAIVLRSYDVKLEIGND